MQGVWTKLLKTIITTILKKECIIWKMENILVIIIDWLYKLSRIQLKMGIHNWYRTPDE